MTGSLAAEAEGSFAMTVQTTTPPPHAVSDRPALRTWIAATPEQPALRRPPNKGPTDAAPSRVRPRFVQAFDAVQSH